jgi:hypothetical protein
MGVTCASFSLFGKIPEFIDMFIIFVIGDKSDILPSFINLTEILSLLEDWKQALDCNEYIVSILMDLSKAFDCLPHDILICKFSAYGLSDNATKLLLQNIYYLVKIWRMKRKGAVVCIVVLFYKIKYIIYEYIKKQKTEN